MHLTPRIEQAVTKLYKAFHNNTLHPECCKKCAVGNICNNLDFWQHLSDAHGSLQLNYIGRVHQQLGTQPVSKNHLRQHLLWASATLFRPEKI